jgi:hypothetical protein
VFPPPLLHRLFLQFFQVVLEGYAQANLPSEKVPLHFVSNLPSCYFVDCSSDSSHNAVRSFGPKHDLDGAAFPQHCKKSL